MKKTFSILLSLMTTAIAVQAQIVNPVKWEIDLDDSGSPEKAVRFKATLDKGWHLYDMNLPQGGPVSTSFTFETLNGAELMGEPVASVKPVAVYDGLFDMELRWFADAVTFTQKIKVTDAGNFRLAGEVEFMACNDETCLPPERVAFAFGAKANGAGVSPPPSPADFGKDALWTPVIDEMKAFGDATLSAADRSGLFIFFAGFIGGLIALLTPCVWPMIPMTVSFFLKRTQERKKAVRDAAMYGVAIIVIYLAMGLILTAVFGASALNDLSTHAVFNLLFCLLLIVFAVSFFGAFELVLPASWTNRLDRKADSSTGLLSIFFMAFTLTLVSFSCTGPIIGTLLVQAAAMGSIAGPAIGMFGFALALAVPFALFAVFPNLLQNMPKSGGWLNSVKVALGFLELALALKFLSVADLAYGWHILDREVFLALWIVIFALLGIYLLGKIRFAHDSELPHVSVPRLFLAMISLAFAAYMIPGLWGAPLKAISAFAPPLYTQDFNLYDSEVHAVFDDYGEGMAYAKRAGKPVMIDFSGFGCVNCRKMEAAVWTDARVKRLLEKEYVLITLFVDDKKKLPQAIEISENGRSRKLKTVGDKWSYLQRSKFGANAQPFYVLLDNEGKPLAPSYSYDADAAKYVRFLQDGLARYKRK
ncbi:MAG: thiol:disulfide interchange/thioredoxin family protein [Bacteroidales bacterium]